MAALKGKVAIVTGAGRGIGKEICLYLAKEGANIVVNDLGGDRDGSGGGRIADEVVEEIKNLGSDAVANYDSVSTVEGGNNIFQSSLDAFGGADILINNAGGPPPGTWQDWTNEHFLSAINANMLTPIKLIQSVLPSMIKKKWGRIVNITSGAVKAPIPALGLSNSARAGLTGFVAGVSRQVAKDGVCINNVLPGVHDTDRIKAFDETSARDLNITVGEARKIKAASIPVGHYGKSEDFGNTCAFLCSQHAAFIIGQNLVVDGGAINATI